MLISPKIPINVKKKIKKEYLPVWLMMRDEMFADTKKIGMSNKAAWLFISKITKGKGIITNARKS